MKKWILLFVICYLLFVAPVGVFAQTTQTATLSLDPSSGAFNQGCSFSLKVILDTGSVETDGTDAILIYDATRFNAVNIVNGSVYPDYPGNNIDAQNGKVTISGLASVNAPFSGKGTLATINFTVLSTAPAGATQIKFDFDPQNKGETRDSNVVQRVTIADVLNSVVNGNYTIGTGSCGTQPAATAVPRPIGAISTPSATFIPIKTLPEGGTVQLTSTVAIVSGVLIVLGILGLALL